jgi:predicted PhzF superfamily epimerase YddE/YHI9
MRLLQVDAFTDRPFRGNPAAVCIMDGARDTAWMQSIAAEMNLSETAFLEARPDGWSLRWFTPTTEVDLCGHATLASAHVLWEEKLLPPGEIARFHTRSGLLTAEPKGRWIELDFPATPSSPAAAPPGMLESLGIDDARAVEKSVFDYLIEVGSDQVVRDLKPDFSRLQSVEARGMIVTSRSSDSGSDFVSRYFAPGFGIDEDPVTGSTHCALVPYWSTRLGRENLEALQLSRRGGRLRLQLAGDRVKIAGQAVTVLRGELTVHSS